MIRAGGTRALAVLAALLPPPSAPAWRPLRPGVEWAEVAPNAIAPVAHDEIGGAVRLVVVRADPRALAFSLAMRVARGATGTLHGAWSVDDAPAGAALAVNAGQFAQAVPWGWLVRDGVELRRPGRGTLAAAVVVTRAGAVRVIPPAALDSARAAGGVRAAFQSYPMLLAPGGQVPPELRVPNAGLDRAHRDARLALGVLPDGRVVLALTRVTLPRAARALPARVVDAAEGAPLGLTVPEMAEVMRALGCDAALLLDGGISAQLLARDAAGEAHTWRGWRDVPLGLVAFPRARPW